MLKDADDDTLYNEDYDEINSKVNHNKSVIQLYKSIKQRSHTYESQRSRKQIGSVLNINILSNITSYHIYNRRS